MCRYTNILRMDGWMDGWMLQFEFAGVEANVHSLTYFSDDVTAGSRD